MKFILAGAAVIAVTVISRFLQTAKEKRKPPAPAEDPVMTGGRPSTDLLKELRMKAYL